MSYTIRQSGRDSGPFSLERLREMRGEGSIGPMTMFKRAGGDVWLSYVDVQAELDGDPPPLPAPGAQAPPPAGCAKTAKIFAVMIGAMLALPVAAMLLAPRPSPEAVKAREAQERAESARRAEVWKAEELGGKFGRADGAEIGATGRRKPSLDEIRLLCVSRGVANGIDKMDKERIAAFWSGYEAAFKDAYKKAADW